LAKYTKIFLKLCCFISITILNVFIHSRFKLRTSPKPQTNGM
jgi:hypothetical protein